MQKLTTRFLVTSLLLVVLISCKSYHVEGATKVASTTTNFQNLYFSNSETDYVYKAHIEVYGNDLSGIFVVKKVNDSVHRVVLTTDFGNKLLDFELSENDFKVNYIVDDLNKKIGEFVIAIQYKTISFFNKISEENKELYDELVHNFDEDMIAQPLLSEYFNIVNQDIIFEENSYLLDILKQDHAIFKTTPDDKSKYNGKKRYKIF